MSRKAPLVHYFDSSILLRYAIRHTDALIDIAKYTYSASSSVITKVECLRVLDRWRLSKEISDARLAEARSRCIKLIASLRLIDLDESVIELASQTFPLAIKTLNALHLATALRMMQVTGSRVIMLTHDQKLALGSQSLGIESIGCAP